MSGSVWYLSFSKKKIEFEKYPKKIKPKKKIRPSSARLKKNKTKKHILLIFFYAFFLLSLSFVAAAVIDEDLHLNIQTYYDNGTARAGTFDFVFNISNSTNCSDLSTIIYTNSTTLTTDSRGIISYYLPDVSLDYDIQYYLCYYRDGTLINSSKISRTPYTFRARNITLSGVEVDTNFDATGYNVTADNGFFSFLGSLLNQITTLFTQNIQFNGTINGSGNITTTGRIGIGTENPAEALDVVGNIQATGPFQTTGNEIIYAGSTLGQVKFFRPATTDDIALYAGGAERVRINGTGYVGINTATPQNILNVVGDGNFSGNLYLNNATFNDGWTSGGVSILGGNLYAQRLYVYNISTLNVLQQNLSIIDDIRAYGNAQIDKNLTVDTNSLFINSNIDRVGIGTTNPQQKLDVNGVIAAGNTTDGVIMRLNGNVGNILGIDTALSTYNDLDIRTTAGTQLYLKNDGNVGIGTTSPEQKLEVLGLNSAPGASGSTPDGILRLHPTSSNAIVDMGMLTSPAYGWIQPRDRTNFATNYNLVLNPNGGNVGIGTTTPQNTLNVAGDINSTGTIYAQNTKNLSIGYDYALNGTIGNSQWQGNWTNFTALYANDVTNASTRGYALNDSLWTLNYSDYLTTKTYAGNDTLWTANYSTYLTKPTWANIANGTMASWANVVNGTMLSYAQALNNTLMQQANWNATNTSYFDLNKANTAGAFNQTFDTNTLFIDSVSHRVGIGTASPQNTLNVVGDINSTGTIYAQNTKNLSIGYDYALNGTIGNSQWQGNWTNFTALYANQVTNSSVYNYATNASLWTLNYSTYLTKPTWANVINGTAISMTTGAYALNSSLWTLNYSDYLTTKTYAGNDTLWTANYSTYLTKPTWANIANGTMASWANVVNGTMLSYAQALNNTLMQQANWNATNTSYFDLNKANTAGAFNQTFDTNTLFIDSVSHRVGIGTMVTFWKITYL